MHAQSVSIKVSGTEYSRWTETVADHAAQAHNMRVRSERQMREMQSTQSANMDRMRQQVNGGFNNGLGHNTGFNNGFGHNTGFNNMSNERELPESREEVFESSVDIFKFAMPVSGPCMLAGQYAFPFRFQLPANLPGTFSFSGRVIGRIEYKIKGLVEVAGLLKSDIKHTVSLHVIERPLTMDRLRCVTDSEISACCFSQGSVSFDVAADKNSYCVGEQLTVFAKVVNQSKKDIKELRLELVSVLNLRSSNGRAKTVSSVVSSTTAAGLAKGGQSVSELPLRLTVPNTIQQQSLGFNVRHYYIVRVKGVVSWASDAVMEVPVGVFVPTPSVQAAPVPIIPNWQPQSAPVVVINLPAAPASPPGIDLSLFANLRPF